MSPAGAIFVPFPPKTGTTFVHPPPPELLNESRRRPSSLQVLEFGLCFYRQSLAALLGRLRYGGLGTKIKAVQRLRLISIKTTWLLSGHGANQWNKLCCQSGVRGFRSRGALATQSIHWYSRNICGRYALENASTSRSTTWCDRLHYRR